MHSSQDWKYAFKLYIFLWVWHNPFEDEDENYAYFKVSNNLAPKLVLDLIQGDLVTRDSWKNWAERTADPAHICRLTLLTFWGWPSSLFEADPTPSLGLTLLTFWGWPCSLFEADPAHFFWLTLLPVWGWPCSLFLADPTPMLRLTLLSC